MAENTVSQNTSIVKENSTISIEFVGEKTPVVLSTEVALRFQKKHKHILDEIKRIQSIVPKSFTEPNFRPSEYTDPTGRPLPCYHLTRDAFSLLAMGFTGKAAIQWKLRYIEAFNALEAAVLKNARQEALELGRKEALAEGLRLASSLSPLALSRIGKLRAYRERGFTQREAALVMGLHRRTVQKLEHTARALGLAARSDSADSARALGLAARSDSADSASFANKEVRHAAL